MLNKLKKFISKESPQNISDYAPEDQKIEAPNDDDVKNIAEKLIHARAIAQEFTDKELNGSLDDLDIIQSMLDYGYIKDTQTYELQSLGIAFGKILIENNNGYDWWMVEDQYGRDPCVRYLETSLMSFPQTMISKRIEDGEEVDIADLYNGLVELLDETRRDKLETEH